MARALTINAPRGGKRMAVRERAAIGYVRRSTVDKNNPFLFRSTRSRNTPGVTN